MTRLTLRKAFIVGTLLASSIGALTTSSALAADACQDRLPSLQARIDSAPAGWDTSTAKEHYQAAEKAMASMNEQQCLKEADATQLSLKEAESAAIQHMREPDRIR